jgi:hypothetical protein
MKNGPLQLIALCGQLDGVDAGEAVLELLLLVPHAPQLDARFFELLSHAAHARTAALALVPNGLELALGSRLHLHHATQLLAHVHTRLARVRGGGRRRKGGGGARRRCGGGGTRRSAPASAAIARARTTRRAQAVLQLVHPLVHHLALVKRVLALSVDLLAQRCVLIARFRVLDV